MRRKRIDDEEGRMVQDEAWRVVAGGEKEGEREQEVKEKKRESRR